MVMLVAAAASSFLRRTTTALCQSRGLAASVGDKIPSVELQAGWPPQKHNLADFAATKNIILMGLPGACT